MVSEVSSAVVVGGGSVVGMLSDVEVGGSVGSSVVSSVVVGPGGFSSTQEQTEAAALSADPTICPMLPSHSERMQGRAVVRMASEDAGVQRPTVWLAS